MCVELSELELGMELAALEHGMELSALEPGVELFERRLVARDPLLGWLAGSFGFALTSDRMLTSTFAIGDGVARCEDLVVDGGGANTSLGLFIPRIRHLD